LEDVARNSAKRIGDQPSLFVSPAAEVYSEVFMQGFKSRIFLAAVISFLSLGSFAFAAGASSGGSSSDSVLLQYNLKEGDVFPYRLTIDMNSKGKAEQVGDLSLNATLQLVLRMTVLKVNPDSTYQIEARISDPKVTANGQELQLTNPEVPPIVMTVTRTGAVKEIRGLEGLGGGSVVPGLDPTSFSNLMTSMAIFPEKPLKVNDTWSYNVPVTVFGNSKAVATAKCRLVAVETDKNGVPVAKVNTSVTVPLDITLPPPANTTVKGTQTGQVNTVFARESGMPLDANGNMNMKMRITVPANTGPDGKPTGKPVSVDMDLKMQMKMALAPELKQAKPAQSAPPASPEATDKQTKPSSGG